jgi:glycosyltransferase involved in cell wall biosynthesis
MKIGVFSLIPWNFLDQRPQMMARKLAEWGHEVVYFETFEYFDHWDDQTPHPWGKYWERAWHTKHISARLTAVNPLMVPAQRRFAGIQDMNIEFEIENKRRIAQMGLDLAIVIDPQWGRILDELEIPYIYDHVDDTHHMNHVMKDFFFNAQLYSERHSLTTFYIQPQIARRMDGLFVPNGTDEKDILHIPQAEKKWDAALLSCLADWFDIDSLLESKKKILMIGPIHEPSLMSKYIAYRASGGKNLEWIPRVPRKVGLQWLNYARVGLIPFRQDHGVVDYVMPLKIIEYFALGLPTVSYVNKGLIDAFGDHVYSYSPTGWLGFPDLDGAIDLALSENRSDERRLERMRISQEYTWDKVFEPFKELVGRLGHLQHRLGKRSWTRTIIQEEASV